MARARGLSTVKHSKDPNEGDPAEEWQEPDETTGLTLGEAFDAAFCRGLGGPTAPAH